MGPDFAISQAIKGIFALEQKKWAIIRKVVLLCQDFQLCDRCIGLAADLGQGLEFACNRGRFATEP